MPYVLDLGCIIHLHARFPPRDIFIHALHDEMVTLAVRYRFLRTAVVRRDD